MPRLFFALWPDAAVRGKLYRAAQAAHRGSGGRLMRRANLHQTLVFVGTVADDGIASVKAAAAGINAPPFNLEFGSTGYWRHNRIIWAAPAATPLPLTALVGALEAGLARAGIDFDRRLYSPHVTLVRDARAPTSLPPMCFDWPARDFVLVESGRDSSGVAYRVIARWPLAA
jgi:RNA 2',3'-cyclic 3'-phosphodiesterase